MNMTNKTVVFLGDSITEGYGTSDPDSCYVRLVKDALGLKAAYNHGIGGTRIAYQQKPSEKARHDLYYCGRAYDLEPDADVVVVFGGTNDYGHGDAPLGTAEDTAADTFYGAVNCLIRVLQERYPNVKLVFLTPARRMGDLYPSQDSKKGSDRHPLRVYAEVILEQCGKYHIPVLDLYEELGIDPNREDHRNQYTVDGLHFNDQGHVVIAQKVCSFLNQI